MGVENSGTSEVQVPAKEPMGHAVVHALQPLPFRNEPASHMKAHVPVSWCRVKSLGCRVHEFWQRFQGSELII